MPDSLTKMLFVDAANVPERRVKRALLHAAGPHALVQDRIDCADLALDAGMRELGTRLYSLVLLELGRTSASAELFLRVNERWALWAEGPAHVAANGTGQFAFDLANAELQQLSGLRPALQRVPDFPEDDTALAVHVVHGSDADRHRQLAEQIGPMLELAAVGDEFAMAAWIVTLAERTARLRPIKLEEHLDATTAELGDLLLLERTRLFVAENSDIIHATSSGRPLFAVSAGLASAGLGPYFSNVRRLIRTTSDIFTLISAAVPDASASDLELWATLLSTHLDPGQITEFADQLGDRGMIGALQRLLMRISRMPASSDYHEALRRIRDAFIDLGELDLALVTQRKLVSWHELGIDEWLILAHIFARIGDGEAAKQAFGRAVSIGGADRNRLGAPAPDALDLSWGGGSSPDRVRLRGRFNREETSGRSPSPR